MPRKLASSQGAALLLLAGAATIVLAFWLGKEAGARDLETRLRVLFAASTNVTNEPISYPSGRAKVTAVVLTLQPGEETGFHTHPIPAAGYILEGELTVDYDGQASRIYKAGDAVLEAMSVAHNGRNTGSGPMRILAVFMGSEGQPLSIPLPASNPASK
jgi:quercetin dioxygenase-like cupin family protein